MKYVLTLIGKPAARDLTAARLATVRGALVGAGAAIANADWLAPELACDLPFDGIEPAAAETAAHGALAGAAIDIAAQPAAGRRKALLIADMDSTVITVECIDELADFAGRRAEIAAITEQAMRGELDFEAALRARAAMLAKLPEAALAQAFEERVRLSPGAATLVATMRAAGAYTALVSGGFTYFTERVRRLAGFDMDRANRLIIRDGRLTGAVAEPVLGRGAKLATLLKLLEERGLGPADALAVGDGANDIDMVEAAGMGVAYHAKPVLAAAADARIEHGDLTALLYLQGYRKDAFAA